MIKVCIVLKYSAWNCHFSITSDSTVFPLCAVKDWRFRATLAIVKLNLVATGSLVEHQDSSNRRITCLTSWYIERRRTTSFQTSLNSTKCFDKDPWGSPGGLGALERSFSAVWEWQVYFTCLILSRYITSWCLQYSKVLSEPRKTTRVMQPRHFLNWFVP